MRFTLASLVCACLCTTATAAVSERAFTLADYANVVSVGDPQISPDGRRVAVVVGHVDMAKDRTNTELVLIDVRSGERRVLTHGRDEVGSPRWSPDGRSISFVAVAGSGDDAAPQVWVMPMDGGDAQPVTTAQYGVEAYAWRPDGKAIAYVTQDPPENEAARSRHEDLFNVGDDPFSTQSPARPSHIWLQELSGAAPLQLTSGPSSVFADSISWSRDGRYIAFTHEPDGRFDSVLRARVAVLDVASRDVQIVDSRWSWQPSFSPYSDDLGYTAGAHDSVIMENDLDVWSDAAGVRAAAPALDRDVSYFAWMPGGGFIVAANDRVTRALWRVGSDGAIRRVPLGDLAFGGGSVAGNGAIAFTAESSTHPSEVYFLAPGSDEPRRLTDYNADIASLDLAPTKEFVWHNDGFEEDGALTYPLGYVAGKTYPLVLVIHGGPVDEASLATFDSLAQLLAARGFIVLQPNYRGSDNLGYAYAHAIVGDNPIAGPGRDVVAGVRALEATGVVDASRIGVSGWSAGGWTTSWLITHYDLWKAAVSGAAVDDAVLSYSISQINLLMPMLFGGKTPWATPGGLDLYRAASPISYVENDHAATLILSDTTDPRVPTPESYEFYTALRDLGKVVQFTTIPAYGHHPSDPVRNREIDRVWVDWMVKYLSP